MAESHELTFTSKTSSQRPRPTFADIGGYRHHEQDVSTLARLGKKQTLKVRSVEKTVGVMKERLTMALATIWLHCTLWL